METLNNLDLEFMEQVLYLAMYGIGFGCSLGGILNLLGYGISKALSLVNINKY